MSGILKECSITESVYNAIVSHALTTESEEVMGLLLGESFERARAGCTAGRARERTSN